MGDEGGEIRPLPEFPLPSSAALVDATALIEPVCTTGCVGCVVCTVAGELVVGRPTGKVRVGIGNGECVRCRSGSAAAAAASDGAIVAVAVAVAVSRNVAAPAHATSEAIEASRPRAERGRGRAGEGGRDTGRRPSTFGSDRGLEIVERPGGLREIRGLPPHARGGAQPTAPALIQV